tara:strand:+ start:677 stop:3256 length:2580 start_codon:yes stop_codon:yes gene_type:complete
MGLLSFLGLSSSSSKPQATYSKEYQDIEAKYRGGQSVDVADKPKGSLSAKQESSGGFWSRLFGFGSSSSKGLSSRDVKQGNAVYEQNASKALQARAKNKRQPLSKRECQNLLIVMTKPKEKGGAGLTMKEAVGRLSAQGKQSLYRNYGHLVVNSFRAANVLPDKLAQQESILLFHFMTKPKNEGGAGMTYEEACDRMGRDEKAELFAEHGYASKIGKPPAGKDQISGKIHSIYDNVAKEAMAQVESKINVEQRLNQAKQAAFEAAKKLPRDQWDAKIAEVLDQHEKQLMLDIAREYDNCLGDVRKPLEEFRGDVQKKLTSHVYQHDKGDADTLIRGELAGLDVRINREAQHAAAEYAQAKMAAVRALTYKFSENTGSGSKAEAQERVDERLRNWDSYQKEHVGDLAEKPKTVENEVVEMVVDGDVFTVVRESQEELDAHYQEERDKLFAPDKPGENPLTLPKAEKRVAVLQQDMDLIDQLREKHGFYSPNTDSTRSALESAKADLARLKAEQAEDLKKAYEEEEASVLKAYEDYDMEAAAYYEEKALEEKRAAQEAKMKKLEERIETIEKDSDKDTVFGGLDVFGRASAAKVYYEQKGLEEEVAKKKAQEEAKVAHDRQVERYTGLQQKEIEDRLMKEGYKGATGVDAVVKYREEQRAQELEASEKQKVDDVRSALEVNLAEVGESTQADLVDEFVNLLNTGDASKNDIESFVQYLRQIPMEQSASIFEQVAHKLGDDKALVYTKLMGSKAFISLAYELNHQTQLALERAGDRSLPSSARQAAQNRAVLLGQYEQKLNNFMDFLAPEVGEDSIRNYERDISLGINRFSTEERSGFFGTKKVFKPDVTVAAAVSNIRVRS